MELSRTPRRSSPGRERGGAWQSMKKRVAHNSMSVLGVLTLLVWLEYKAIDQG